MANYGGALAYSRGAQECSDRPIAYPVYGVSSTTTLTAATSSNIPLPVDANGRLYPAYMFVCDSVTWINFCSANTDTAAAFAANNYPINASSLPAVLATPQAIINGGAGAGAFVAAVSTPGGHITVMGIL